MHTRPTADRVREALFSILFDVEGYSVLDLFAGSGAVGLEALSRGAERCVFVENDRPALNALETNIDALGVGEKTEVIKKAVAPAMRALIERGDRFDLVFADPPWDDAIGFFTKVGSPALVADEGSFVLEHGSREASPAEPEGMILSDQRRYGDTALSFYQRSRS